MSMRKYQRKIAKARMAALGIDRINRKMGGTLTVAHLNHTPEDCRQENLRALCAPCHLRYDAQHHAETRRRKRGA